MRLPGRAVAVLVLLWSSALPHQGAAAATCRKVPVAGLDVFGAAGPHPVGVRTITFVDTSRPTPPAGTFPGAPERTLVTEIWYPALEPGRETPVASAGAPYPVIVYSHGGGGGQRLEADFIGAHLSSRGFIVAAPDFPLTSIPGVAKAGLVPAILDDVINQPGDLSFVLDGVLAAFGTAADAGRVGATGHSIGGLTTLLVTFHRDVRDPRIRAALPLAPPACILARRFYRTVKTPLLIVHGDTDQVAYFDNSGRRGYRNARPPRFLVRLANGSHLGFTLADGPGPAVHPDRLACTFLEPLFVDLDPDDPFDHFASVLGGAPAGIESSRCVVSCSRAIPDQPAMPPLRHRLLTRAAEAAFFEAYLRGDDIARCFLRRTLKRESDVTVKSSGAGRPIR